MARAGWPLGVPGQPTRSRYEIRARVRGHYPAAMLRVRGEDAVVAKGMAPRQREERGDERAAHPA
jgi:hypothetical protein